MDSCSAASKRMLVLSRHLNVPPYTPPWQLVPLPASGKKTQLSEDIEADITSGSSSEKSEYTEELDITAEPNPLTGRYEIHPIPHHLSFDQGFFHAIRAIELLVEKNPDSVVIVGIAGPTGAGKTTLAAKISALLDATIIPLENFVQVEQVREGNVEDPNVIEFNLVVNALHQLKTQRVATIPKLNKSTFSREYVDLKAPKSNIIIVEGSYALNPMLRPLLDVSIAINGGVHLDLIKRIMRDIATTSVAHKETIFQITNVVFPMFKAFIQPDLEQAKIKIHSTYNPMTSLVEPTYVCKARYQTVKEYFDGYFDVTNPVKKIFSDMYLYPPKYNSDAADRTNWIRIRRSDGHFHIHFYNETMEPNINTRPTLNFEIGVRTLSGLLSLGYQIGAILNRTVEIWHDKDGIIVTKEYIKELEKYYVQIKGRNRRDVMSMAEKLHIGQHHIPQTFLYLYFRKLKKPKNQKQ